LRPTSLARAVKRLPHSMHEKLTSGGRGSEGGSAEGMRAGRQVCAGGTRIRQAPGAAQLARRLPAGCAASPILSGRLPHTQRWIVVRGDHRGEGTPASCLNNMKDLLRPNTERTRSQRHGAADPKRCRPFFGGSASRQERPWQDGKVTAAKRRRSKSRTAILKRSRHVEADCRHLPACRRAGYAGDCGSAAWRSAP
jgi:hypothetical protein